MKILAILQLEEEATVDYLAQSVGLASATIRRHLDILQRDHLVSFRQARKKLGRPEYVYSLTEEGKESGHRDYGRLLGLMLREIKSLTSEDLSEKSGEELLPTIFSRVSSQLSLSYAISADNAPMATRLTLLQHALGEEGFAPHLSVQNDHAQIRLYNCPFRSAALCHDSVCCIDHNLITTILGVEPVRLSSIHEGDTTCAYSVPLGD